MDDAQSCLLTGTKWNDENSLLTRILKLPNYELCEKMIRKKPVALKFKNKLLTGSFLCTIGSLAKLREKNIKFIFAVVI